MIVPAPAPTQASLDLDHLEAAAAADTPTSAGARWVSHRAMAHLLSEAGSVDPATGDPLWGPLTAALRRLRDALHNPQPDLPSDEVQRVVAFAVDPLSHIVRSPRSRLVRHHEVVPLNRLREADSKSMAWMSRLPGRSAREKLGMRQRALAVQRQVVVDAPENQLARWVLEAVVEHAERRLRGPTPGESEAPNRAALAKLVDLRHRDLHRSPLADVAPLPGVRPNNALLSDRNYAKVLRTWRRLRDLDDRLLCEWSRLDQHVETVLFWSLVAELVGRGAHVHERLCRSSPEGVDLAAPSSTLTCTLLLDPNRRSTQRVRVHLADGALRVDALRAKGTGPPLLSAQVVVDSRKAFGVRRGVRVSVTQTAAAGFSLARREAADVEGIRSLVVALADQVPSTIQAPPFAAVPDGSVVSIDARRGYFDVYAESGAHTPRASPYALRLLDPDADEHWVAGQTGAAPDLDVRETLVSNRALERVRTDGDPDTARAEAALGVQTSLAALANELPSLRNAQVALTVPDTLGLAALRTLRAGASSALGTVLPVWRSIAAAIGWAGTSTKRFNEGDVLLVLDPRDAFLSVTVLTAQIDPRLADAVPASRGIVWERRPPLVPGEVAQSLAMDNLLADGLGAPSASDTTPDAARTERPTDHLVQTGLADRLIFGDAPVFAPSRDSWRQLHPDPPNQRRALADWQDAFVTATHVWSEGGALADTLRRLKSGHPKATLHVLLVGHPFRDLPNTGVVRDALAHLARPFPPPKVDWADPAHHLLARGAHEAARRSASGLPTWTEWVPSLHLLVAQHSLYDTLQLLESRRVRPLLGERITYHPPRTLTLQPGPAVYRIPVLTGEHAEQPTSHTIVLRSPAFPLQEPRPVTLSFTYQMGATDDHLVEIVPADGRPLSVTGRWEDLRPRVSHAGSPWSGGIHAGDIHSPPPDQLDDLVAQFDEELDRVCRGLAPDAPPDHWKRVERPVRNLLRKNLLPLSPSTVHDVASRVSATPALRWLQWLAHDGTETEAERMRAIGPPPEKPRVAAVELLLRLGLLSERLEADLVDELRLGRTSPSKDRLSAVDAARAFAASGTPAHLAHLWAASRTPLLFYKNTSLYNNVVGGLASVGLQNPDALLRLAAINPDAPGHLVQLAEFALERLAQSLPDALARESRRAPEEDSRQRVFASPFENACKLLLAITALRETHPDVLQTGGERALYIATLVAIIDGMIRQADWGVASGISLPDEDQRPPSVTHLSRLAAITTTFLLGEPPLAAVTVTP